MKKIENYDFDPQILPNSKDLIWKVDPSRSVLLIHDMQNYFVSPFENNELIKKVIEKINSIRFSAYSNSIPVIYSVHPGRMTLAERGLLYDLWGEGMTNNLFDRGIVSELIPQKDDIIVTKWRYSAFFDTTLNRIFRRLNRDQLIICGVYAHAGCLATALDAYSLDIQVFMALDAMADFDAEKHYLTGKLVNELCGITSTANDIVKAFSRNDT